jgi:hypothetical protein
VSSEIVQHGPTTRNGNQINGLNDALQLCAGKMLILLRLWAWLAALDDFRNWLIREAA